MSWYLINLVCVAMTAYTAGYFKDNPFAVIINSIACLLNLIIVAQHIQ